MSQRALNILTFNWHEAYVSMLAGTGHRFDVVQRTKAGLWYWFYTTRPVPNNVRLVPLEDVRRRLRAHAYDLAICHTPADVEEIRHSEVPAILVFHNHLQTEVALSRATGVRHFSEHPELFDSILGRVSPVFISAAKRRSWGCDGAVIPPGVDVGCFSGYRGERLRVLRVGNFLKERDLMMGGELQQQVLRGLPHTTLGLNPSIPDSGLSPSFDELREAYRSHRVFVHTTRPGFEDGYNLSLLEAMSTGMPVVSLAHPSSPLVDDCNGVVRADATNLRAAVLSLLENPTRCRRLGDAARHTVASQFPVATFRDRWNGVIETHASRAMHWARDIRVRPSVPRRRVLLLYAASSATPARHIDRALRRSHLVVSAGPADSQSAGSRPDLPRCNEPFPPAALQGVPDICVTEDTSLSQIWSRLPPGFEPELVLWVDTGSEFLPSELTSCPVPTAGYFVDCHRFVDRHLSWAAKFDHAFVARKDYVDRFINAGASAHWLPLACDPEVHRAGNRPQEYDVGILGEVTASGQGKLLREIRERHSTVANHSSVGQMSESFSGARILWNCTDQSDPTAPVFEALSAGSFLLTEKARSRSAQDALLREDVHFATYEGSNLLRRIDYFLKRSDLRREIATAGRSAVHAQHTYDHRTAQLLRTVALGKPEAAGRRVR